VIWQVSLGGQVIPGTAPQYRALTLSGDTTRGMTQSGVVRLVLPSYEVGTFVLEATELVNPGSVGQPRDGDPDASYGVWDRGAGTFEFRRVAYDRDAAKKAIRDAGLPERFALRLDVGR